MNRIRLKKFLHFPPSQQLGILLLAGIIVMLQVLIYSLEAPPAKSLPAQGLAWLALQKEIDSARLASANVKPAVYPFNPNFISDHKGYVLGMSVEEIDRLHAFRKQNKFVNSAAEFQNITKVSDSLLAVISLQFKFPDWVNNRKSQQRKPEFRTVSAPLADINSASAADLMKVYGIGPAFSERIIRQREILGAFVDMRQISDVWGLQPEVVENVCKKFKVIASPQVKRIAINKASVKELSQFPYFRYAMAKSIVTYRSMNGDIKSAADLAKIKDFPIEKLDIIAVYLDF